MRVSVQRLASLTADQAPASLSVERDQELKCLGCVRWPAVGRGPRPVPDVHPQRQVAVRADELNPIEPDEAGSMARAAVRSTPESSERVRHNGAKRKKGFRIHMAMDTLGHLLRPECHISQRRGLRRGRTVRPHRIGCHRRPCRDRLGGSGLHRRARRQCRGRTRIAPGVVKLAEARGVSGQVGSSARRRFRLVARSEKGAMPKHRARRAALRIESGLPRSGHPQGDDDGSGWSETAPGAASSSRHVDG